MIGGELELYWGSFYLSLNALVIGDTGGGLVDIGHLDICLKSDRVRPINNQTGASVHLFGAKGKVARKAMY